MAFLQADDIADLVQTTLDDLGELRFTDLMSTYQNTVFLKRMIRKHKTTFEAGTAVRFNAITDTNGSARAVGLYYTAQVNPTNAMINGEMPWRHVTWNWGIDRREIAMNRQPRKIVDLVKVRRMMAFGAAVKFFEQRGWRVPASTDNDNFMGIPYWIVKSNTAVTTNDGFNGTVPSGYTVVGGINPTTYAPKWSNYATQYTSVTKSDLVSKMWRAMTFTQFEPLVDDVPTYNTGDDYGIYTTYSVISSLKEILESQNDNLGNDLDSMEGKLMFRRTPISWVKELQDDTTNPLYGINWGVLKVQGLRGEWMKETTIPVHSNQPTVSATHTDCTLNTYCPDRRRLWVLATDTTMPA